MTTTAADTTAANTTMDEVEFAAARAARDAARTPDAYPRLDLLAPHECVDQLAAARDEVGALDHQGTNLLDRDTVLAILRRHTDALVFSAPEVAR